MIEPPVRIAGYENWALLGRGGFATVYRAHHVRLDRSVAVKILTVGPFDEAARHRFAREQQTMGTLSTHPAIVTLYDAGFAEGGAPYLIMELMSGGSMRDRLREEGRLPWREAVEITRRISDAVASAHERGVLHRDIKPDNILVSAFGEAKLADFGIATLVEGSATATASVTATLQYAAPEILSGERATAACDVYGLSATLFALLSGQPAFTSGDEESAVTVLARVLSAPVPDLRPAGIPEAVCRVVELGMAKDPEDRPASAERFGESLDEALSQGERGGEATNDLSPLVSTRVLGREQIDQVVRDAGGGGQATRRLGGEAVEPVTAGPGPGRRRIAVLIGGIVLASAAVAVAMVTLRDGAETAASTTADTAPATTAVSSASAVATPATDSAVPGWACGVDEQALLHEGFEDDSAPGWDGVDGGDGWEIAGGSENRVLQAVYRGDLQLSSIAYRAEQFGDVALRFAMRMEGSGDRALQVDWRLGEAAIGEESYDALTYLVQFETDRGRVARLLTSGEAEPQAEELVAWTSSPPALEGWHGYEIARIGGSLEVWIDGRRVATTAMPPDEAQIAVLGFVAQPGDTIELDDLRICLLERGFGSLWPWPPPPTE